MNARNWDKAAQKAALEINLIDYDRKIRKCEEEREQMVRQRKQISAFKSICDFLQTLRQHREMILFELKTAGGSEAEAYQRKEEIERELDSRMV